MNQVRVNRLQRQGTSRMRGAQVVHVHWFSGFI